MKKSHESKQIKGMEASEEEIALIKYIRKTNAFDLLFPLIMGRFTLDPHKSKSTTDSYLAARELERMIKESKVVSDEDYDKLIETAAALTVRHLEEQQPVHF